jgi:hypothetical protein
MCLSCGCGEPDDNHGDDRHIILSDLAAAAEAAEITTEEAARNIVEALNAGQSG